MFRIKICGITSLEDARVAVEAGADAIGLNFFPQSPRFVAGQQAREIAEAVRGKAVRVGVFVNSTVEEILRTVETTPLDAIQLHGDEPPEFLPRLAGHAVVRAFRAGPEGLAPLFAFLAACRELESPPHRVLLDSLSKGAYGGTGTLADWQLARLFAEEPSAPPLVLAGGLTADNVAAAIRAVRPAGVDTASGVESSPGRKDADLVRRFVAAARVAFDEQWVVGSG